MKTIRVLIAEVYPILRERICAIMESAPDLELVGKASRSQEIMLLTQEFQPDTLLLDLKMPKIPPADLVARLYQDCPQMKTLALSDAWGDANIRGLVAAGVLGYVGQNEAPDRIISAIHTVVDGGVWFSQTALQQLIDEDNDLPPVKDFGLTARELEVLRLVVAGKTNRGIALALEISVKTVEKCLTLIYDKLGVDSRVLAAVWAVRNGLA